MSIVLPLTPIPPAAAARRRAPTLALCVLTVLALHVLGLRLWQGDARLDPGAERETPRLRWRLLTAPPPTAPAPRTPPGAAAPLPSPARRDGAAPAAARDRVQAQRVAPSIAADAAPARPAPSPADTTPPAPAANAAPPLDLRLAPPQLRTLTADPSAARRLRGEDPAAPGTGALLEQGMSAAVKGDCAKGDYAGAGMGLLSVPFLAAAAIRGRCAR